MRLRVAVVAALVAVAVVLAAGCSGGDGGSSGIGPLSSDTPAYGGPAIPGLAAKSLWAQRGGAVIAAVAVGNSFALITGSEQGGPISLTVLDAASGRMLSTVPLNESSSHLFQPTIEADSVGGKPVAVARFDASFPASGLQGPVDHAADVVVDASGKTLWSSPARDEWHFAGGYLVAGRWQGSAPFVGGPDPQRVFSDVTMITDLNGTVVADLRAKPIDRLYRIVDGTVLTFGFDAAAPGLLHNRLRALNLAAGGNMVWAGDVGPELSSSAELFLTTANGKVVTQRPDSRRTAVVVRDLASGREIGTADAQDFDCHESSFDASANTVLCVSDRLASTPITAIDVTSGKVVWQQPVSRSIQPGPASNGLAYLRASVTGSDQSVYLVLRDTTGSVVADNLSAAPLAISAAGMAVVEYGGFLYGFRVAR